jgi:phosphoserine phosphatase RsbU/P
VPKKLEQILELKEFKLNSLLEITKAINENYSIENLIKIYEYILREQLGISKAVLFSFYEKWECLLKYGAKGVVNKINIQEDLLHIKEITVIESSSSILSEFDVVIPVYHKQTPLAYLLIGNLGKAEEFSPAVKHMSFIQTLTNIIMVAIENKHFAKQAIYQEIENKELEVARQMQAMLFPQELPSNNRVDVAARYVSKQLVGGDYYDFIQLNPNEYVMCIADVSGKGVSAALLMSNFQAHLKANIKYNHEKLTIKQLMIDLNEEVMKSAKGEKFITFFFAYYNVSKKLLKYVNAGHNYPVLTDGKTARLLNKGCIGLGMLEEIPHIEMEEIEIASNTTLVCYTDGLVELENKEGEAFEVERLIDIIHNNYHLSMVELDELIFKELDNFRKDTPYLDDTALLSCRFL